MRPSVEIISLIYKSTRYARHIADELAKTKSELADISWRLVANDPTPTVKDYLLQQGIPHSLYFDDNPNDYYLNRVYRAWNYSGLTARADLVCFVNSDMVFHENWLDPLIQCWSDFGGSVIPCSLLLESGRMPSKSPAISCPIGQTLDTLDRAKFHEIASGIRKDIYFKGGLYMPCLLRSSLFDDSGHLYVPYPEGNIYEDGVGETKSRFLMSGDECYFNNLRDIFGWNHLTVSASIVGHLQEGEMSEKLLENP